MYKTSVMVPRMLEKKILKLLKLLFVIDVYRNLKFCLDLCSEGTITFALSILTTTRQ